MTSDQESLRAFVSNSLSLSDDEWTDFASIWSPFSTKRKELITTPGSIENYLYFVVEGVQRVYYYDENEKEVTLVLTYAPSFGSVLDSFLLRQPGKYYYEALTPSTFLRAHYDQLMAVADKHPKIDTYIRQSTAIALSGLLERMVELQCFSNTQKLSSLLRRSPHILQLVPHKYLANYLGIDPTNFSKLLNNVKL